jgi:predicted AlkP superfamily phosphohydrolase/phosphomutase
MPGLFRNRKKKRVLVLGLDCAGPQLVFDQFKDDLPTLSSLVSQGTWGELQSSIPCITVPAWASMLSSRDPGVLGVYGFRNRTDNSYKEMAVADSTLIKAKRVWDYVGESGRKSVVIGVPQTYPLHSLTGHMVSCFLTPGTESAFTYPALFKQEVLKVTPDYKFDVRNFRTPDKAWLLQQLMDMTEVQFRLVQYTIKTKPWDFFMHVNIGVDRLHHGFWRFHDPTHRLYEPGNPLNDSVRNYYKLVDAMARQLIEVAGDDVAVLVVSDHGVSRMDGGICINEWLWRNGWLALKNPPPEGKLMPFEQADVDWEHTRAWAAGGYYGRVFLNVEGREPQGVIPADQYEAAREELAAALKAIPIPNDNASGEFETQVFKPQEIYQEVRNIAPDLMIYFGGLHWRAVGSLGHGDTYTLENDTGPDDANHAVNGLFILYEPGVKGAGRVNGHQLMDIAPTLLRQMGIDIPSEMQGKVIAT